MSEEQQQQLQSFAYQLRQMEAQLNAITSQENSIAKVIIESKNAMESLQQFIKSKKSKNSEFMLPIGAGVLIKITQPASDTSLINVGSDILIEKNMSDVIKDLELRITNLETSIVEFQKQRFALEKQVTVGKNHLNSMLQNNNVNPT
tara:strand:+ start:401 stop:841 length:441 start_codon:yes stop_codon:yes gene_type:complete